MKRCPKCNRANSDLVTVCSVCGCPLNSGAAPVTPKPSPAAQAERTSPVRRSAAMEQNAPIQSNPQGQQASQQPPPAGSRPRRFLWLLVLVCFLLGMLAMKVIQSDEKASLSAAESTRQESGAHATRSVRNALLVTLDGQQVEMELTKARILGRKIHATFECTNPRGELFYRMNIMIPSHMGSGEYTSKDASPEVTLMLKKAGSSAVFYADRSAMAQRTLGISAGAYTFRITERSDDWKSYSGTLDAVLDPEYTRAAENSIVLTNGVFHFTLQ